MIVLPKYVAKCHLCMGHWGVVGQNLKLHLATHAT